MDTMFYSQFVFSFHGRYFLVHGWYFWFKGVVFWFTGSFLYFMSVFLPLFLYLYDNSFSTSVFSVLLLDLSHCIFYSLLSQVLFYSSQLFWS